jgi:hypothetical protein
VAADVTSSETPAQAAADEAQTNVAAENETES